MAHLTRIGLMALAASAGASALADVTEAWQGERSQGFVTLAAAATLVGVGLLFLGHREHPAERHLRHVRLGALAWGAGYMVLILATAMGGAAGVALAAVGAAATDAALVVAAWALLGRLVARILTVALALALAGYAAAAVLVLAEGPAVLGLALPGHVGLLVGFALAVPTLPPPGRMPYESKRARGRKLR